MSAGWDWQRAGRERYIRVVSGREVKFISALAILYPLTPHTLERTLIPTLCFI
jgi:hypothetical protein